MTTEYVLIACALPLGVFIGGGMLRFFGSKDIADDEGFRNVGTWLMLGSVIFSLMAHSPNITISFGG